MLYPNVVVQGQATRIGASHVWNLFLTNCVESRKTKSDGAAKKVVRLCAHFICLPASLPFCQRISRSRQAGRTHKRKVEDTEFSSPKISLGISERDERRGLTSIQNLWKLHKPSSSQKHTKIGGQILTFFF
jgi:hypothetical protein